ncbi:uncharacterized protein LOC142357098, partial [Convolutriloba macropyga]|uniref:uncharacterized protein LOC142357098 n=1 Tax=Convolutriloba macropyga TaxID=536237 RepID=UPI003F51F333
MSSGIGNILHKKLVILVIIAIIVILVVSLYGGIGRSDVFYRLLPNATSFNKIWRDMAFSPEEQLNLSIAVLAFENGAYHSSGPRPTSDFRKRCQISFQCFVYYHMDKNFPGASINKFSAIIAWQGSHRRLMPLYKKVGGLAAGPREQFWVSTALESSANRGNGNHMQTQSSAHLCVHRPKLQGLDGSSSAIQSERWSGDGLIR